MTDIVTCDECGKDLLESNAVIEYIVGGGSRDRKKYLHEDCAELRRAEAMRQDGFLHHS